VNEMTEALVNRLYEWRDHLKKCDAWDKGDCTTLALIKQAVESVYGIHPDNYSGYIAPANRQGD